MIKLDRLPSPYSKVMSTKMERSYPAVIAHFNKGELVNLDKLLPTGRKLDRRLGIPNYMGLDPMFTGMIKNPEILTHFSSNIAKKFAKGGSTKMKEVEKLKASFGTGGDTERAIIPKSMARVLNHMVGYSENPYTRDPQYALGSDFISSLSNYMPSMDTIASGIGSAASGMLSGGTNPAAASPSTAATTATPSTTASTTSSTAPDSSKGGFMGSVINNLAPLAPAAISAIGKRLTGGGSSPTAAPSSAPTTTPATSATPAASAQTPAASPSANPQYNPSLMELFQKQMNNNPYYKFANEMYDRYNTAKSAPSMTSDDFHRMMQSYLENYNPSGTSSPQMTSTTGFSPMPYAPTGSRTAPSRTATRSMNRGFPPR